MEIKLLHVGSQSINASKATTVDITAGNTINREKAYWILLSGPFKMHFRIRPHETLTELLQTSLYTS